MKFLEFVQKHPSHAKSALLILAVSFAASFVALVCLGMAIYHDKTVERDTNAALMAGDILALLNWRQECNEKNEAVCLALIDLRMDTCLSQKDAAVLADILTTNDNCFGILCEKLRVVVAKRRCTASVLATVIRESGNKTENSIQLSVDPNNRSTVSPYLINRFSHFDPQKEAETFFGVRFVFRTAGNISYCKNIYSSFEPKKRMLDSFAKDWSDSDSVLLTQDMCANLAINFAQARIGVRKPVIADARFSDGVCWVEITDSRGERYKIGICGDTGSACFYCRMPQSGAV